jgi:hypothetical protein
VNNQKEEIQNKEVQSKKEDTRSRKEDFQKRHKSRVNNLQTLQGGNQPRKNGSEQPTNRERSFGKNHTRDNAYPGRNNHQYQAPPAKHTAKAKAVETIDDIRMDIGRIEKEIELEIKEIRSLRLGI